MTVIMRKYPFEAARGYRFRAKGISGTAIAGATTDIDYKLTTDRWMNGIQIILKDHIFGDYVAFQVVDVDNILGYGAGVVLDTFGEDWFVAADQQSQHIIKTDYPAKMLSGLYIRLKYTSTGGTNVSVKANLFLHQEPV